MKYAFFSLLALVVGGLLNQPDGSSLPVTLLVGNGGAIIALLIYEMTNDEPGLFWGGLLSIGFWSAVIAVGQLVFVLGELLIGGWMLFLAWVSFFSVAFAWTFVHRFEDECPALWPLR